jgi:transposase
MAIPPVPPDTARVARAAFRKGNLYLKLRDELGTLVQDSDFVSLFGKEGFPALPPWRLALVTVRQFRENLADRQAAEAVRARIDWKYLLSLELSDAGFDFSVLSEFRARLVRGGAEELLLEKLLAWSQAAGLVKARGKQRTDSTHVVAAIRSMNRLELVGETLRAALNELAVLAPDWVRTVTLPEWSDRYRQRSEEGRLPKGQEAREAYARTVGEDGFWLLDAVDAATLPALREAASIQTLRRVWQQQYERLSSPPGGAGGAARPQVRWKELRELPRAAEQRESPSELDARYCPNRSTQGLGYKVHYTETCDLDQVYLITQVQTTPATLHDIHCTVPIQAALQQRDLLPQEHIVDAAYIDAAVLVSSQQEYGITLVGPPRPNSSWHTKHEGGYNREQFTVEWDQHQVRCPHGKISSTWTERDVGTSTPSISVHFRKQDCTPCPPRALCTRPPNQPRHLNLLPRAQHEALHAARLQQASEAGQQRYRRRAGIEGTLSHGVQSFGLRRSRYRGLRKTHLQHVMTAVAMNVGRIVAWFDRTPRAKTRTSRFAALAA